MTVTTPKGFLAAGVASGLRRSGRRDLALIQNIGPKSTFAAVTTANRFAAAPVVYTRKIAASGHAEAIVLNSANANACTGPQGDADTLSTAAKVGECLGISPEHVAVCSTGIIGRPMPMEPLLSGVELAARALSPDGGSDAAEAIMTTDTRPKNVAVNLGSYAIGGIAKGSGMLAPELATMLCVLTTDAVLDPREADEALTTAVNESFNRIDSDGCMSTNDTVVLMASGASGVKPNAEEFVAALTRAAHDLAEQLVNDAEGASHVITVKVEEADSESGALAVARAISRSNLFKTAVYGNDPNWGRILSAAGTVGGDVAAYDPADIELFINDVCVSRAGVLASSPDKVDMSDRCVEVRLVLHSGPHAASLLTTDLTHEYVHENSAYSS